MNNPEADWLKRTRKEAKRQIETPHLSADSFTPVWSSASAPQPAIGDGTLVGRYYLRGPMCLLQFYLLGGSTTTWGTGNWSFSLPFAHAAIGISSLGLAHLRDASTNNYDRFALIPTGGSVITTFTGLDNGTNLLALSATAPFTWGVGDNMVVQIEYPIR